MDPYAILATLGFGVFLFNVIFNLLNNQAAAPSARSIDVQDLDLPLELSDISKFNIKDVSVPWLRVVWLGFETNTGRQHFCTWTAKKISKQSTNTLFLYILIDINLKNATCKNDTTPRSPPHPPPLSHTRPTETATMCTNFSYFLT